MNLLIIYQVQNVQKDMTYIQNCGSNLLQTEPFGCKKCIGGSRGSSPCYLCRICLKKKLVIKHVQTWIPCEKCPEYYEE